MKTRILPAAILAAMIPGAAMACTDWKAVAAFDAAIGVHALDTGTSDDWKQHAAADFLREEEKDKAAALADTCQENPK